MDQLAELLRQIHERPDSRGLIVTGWNPREADQVALPPRHTLFQLYATDGRVSCQLYQRCVDVFLGVWMTLRAEATRIRARLGGEVTRRSRVGYPAGAGLGVIRVWRALRARSSPLPRPAVQRRELRPSDADDRAGHGARAGEAALPLAKVLDLTEIDQEPEGDAHFPPIPPELEVVERRHARDARLELSQARTEDLMKLHPRVLGGIVFYSSPEDEMTLSRLRVLALAALLAQTLAAPRAASAQEQAPSTASSEARERFLRGQSAYSQGDYDAAIEEWRAAYDLDARPLILYNLSQAYERSGAIAEAVETLELYLSTTSGEDPNVPTARNRLASMRARLRRTGIVVQDAPAGAEIFVDDRSWGLAPRPDPIAVEPGRHRVRLALEGYGDFEMAISVPAGQAISVSAEMEPLGGAVVQADEEEEGPSRTGGIILIGAGGGLVVTAAVLGGLAYSGAKDAEFSSGGDADRATTLALTSDVLGGVGIAAAAGGLVWWLVARPGDDDSTASTEARRWAAAPIIGPGAVGIDAAVAF